MGGLAAARSLNFTVSHLAPNVKKGRDITAENGKKMGRPLKTSEPKNVSLHLRITQSEAELIQKCSEKLGLPRTDTIMRGIELLTEKIGLVSKI